MEHRVIDRTRFFDRRFPTVSDKHPISLGKAAFCGFFNAFSVYAGECPRCGRAHAERAMPIKSRGTPTKNT